MAAMQSEDDDFVAEPVPDHARTGWPAMFFAIIGIATSLLNVQIVSMIALRYGSTVALCAIAYASLMSAFLGWLLAGKAVQTGFGISLFARWVLGYRGAALFSLMFGSVCVVFFGVEAMIMAASLTELIGDIPKLILLPSVTMVMVPLVWVGMKALVRVQTLTFVLYAVLMLAAFWVSLRAGGEFDWLRHQPDRIAPFGPSLLTSISIMNGMVFACVLVIPDYARFVHRTERKAGQRWVGAAFLSFCFGFQGLVGLWFSTRYLDPNPGSYFVTMLGAGGLVLAIATQLRINLVNMYAGSLAFVNMFEQAANIRVSRHGVVFCFGVLVSIGLTLDFMEHLATMLKAMGIFLIAFTVLLFTDLYVVKPVGPDNALSLPYQVGKIANWRPAAIFSVLASTLIGCLLLGGAGGRSATLWASFATALSQFVLYLGAWAVVRRSGPPADASSASAGNRQEENSLTISEGLGQEQSS